MRRPIRLIVAIANPELRTRILGLLIDNPASDTIRIGDTPCDMEAPNLGRDEDIADLVKPQVFSEGGPSVVLLSDNLHGWHPAESGVELSASTWYKDLMHEMRDRKVDARCAAVALTRERSRIDDVERVLAPDCSQEMLRRALRLNVGKLEYLEPPSKPANQLYKVRPRSLRRPHELIEYFRLRHRVYSIMGYLEKDVEAAPSKLEIDWADTISIHIGAFARKGASSPEKLMGTARVVIAASQNAAAQMARSVHARNVKTLAKGDPILRRKLRGGALEYELPIFYASDDMLRTAIETTQRGVVCCELSRVIVERKFRGLGVSRMLVDEAVARAGRVGVDRMFLECLAAHVPLYEKYGFRLMGGDPQAVIAVKQTMFRMELIPGPAARCVGGLQSSVATQPG